MIDLFGLRKGVDPHHSSVPSDPHEEALAVRSEPGEKRLWAVLLVLDTVSLFIFAGAVAATVWFQWGKALFPANPPQAARRALPPRKFQKPDAQPAPSGTSPKTAAPKDVSGASSSPVQKSAPVIAPTPASKPAAVPHEPKARQPAGTDSNGPSRKLPLGSPSILAPDLPHREAEAAGDGGAGTPSPETETPGTKPKAKSVEFICHASEAREVLLKGPFLVRTGGVKKMVRGDNGAWHLTISLLPGNYKYRCVIDGKKYKVESVEVP